MGDCCWRLWKIFPVVIYININRWLASERANTNGTRSHNRCDHCCTRLKLEKRWRQVSSTTEVQRRVAFIIEGNGNSFHTFKQLCSSYSIQSMMKEFTVYDDEGKFHRAITASVVRHTRSPLLFSFQHLRSFDNICMHKLAIWACIRDTHTHT